MLVMSISGAMGVGVTGVTVRQNQVGTNVTVIYPLHNATVQMPPNINSAILVPQPNAMVRSNCPQRVYATCASATQRSALVQQLSNGDQFRCPLFDEEEIYDNEGFGMTLMMSPQPTLPADNTYYAEYAAAVEQTRNFVVMFYSLYFNGNAEENPYSGVARKMEVTNFTHTYGEPMIMEARDHGYDSTPNKQFIWSTVLENAWDATAKVTIC